MSEDRRWRVLVVEDDPDTRANLADILELDGFEVTGAPSFAAALAETPLEDVFAVILDRKLPDGTADELMPRLRESLPDAEVVVVTGYADLDGAVRALRHGASDYILKPVNPDALRRSLQRILEQRRTGERLARLEREAAERARLADLGAITAKIVHDLGNPLAGLHMLTELAQRRLRDGADPEEVASLLGQVLVTTGHMEQMIREFREFSRAQRLQTRAVDLRELLTDVAAFWRLPANAQGVQVRFRTGAPSGATGLVARLDDCKMRRVLDNLVKNAIEAIGDEGGVVDLAVEATDTGTVRLSIADTGPGIPEGTDVFRLFETTKPEGTGLGLPVCRQIVQAHGGSITYDRKSPRGTVFCVELPLAEPGAEAGVP